MTRRLQHWLLIPVAVAACGVLLASIGPRTAPIDPPVATDAMIAFRLPDGSHTRPVADPRRLPGAVQLQFGARWAGRTIDLRFHALDDAVLPDWQLRPVVRVDGSLPLAGLPLGRWSLHAVAVDGACVHIASGTTELSNERGAVAVPMADEGN